MKKAIFERQNDEQLIVIDCKMGTHKVLLALDTGAKVFKPSSVPLIGYFQVSTKSSFLKKTKVTFF